MTALSQAFGALGDPTRLAIIERLIAKGPAAAGTLHDVADISAPAISRHLKVLREAGLVSCQVDAQRRIYRANPDTLRAVGHWSLSRQAFWDASLERLAAALDKEG